jgi:hypothetical protein
MTIAPPALEFDARPSVLGYMLRAMVPGPLRRPPPFPALRARRRRTPPDPVRLGHFLGLTGLDAAGGLPILYLQAFTFPLQMVILTHPACPLPIWKVLQVRNRMRQHRAVPADATLDVEAAIAAQRILDRGLEVDIAVSVRLDGAIAWEGTTTYLYRGRFGAPGPPADPAPAAPEPAPPGPIGDEDEVARWRTDRGGGLRFSSVTGDYNGIHCWNGYARLFGFRGAFHHPHAVVGQCLARLPAPPAAAQRLDLWLKGPVYYGTEVALAARAEAEGVAFALAPAGAERPALLGRWS